MRDVFGLDPSQYGNADAADAPGSPAASAPGAARRKRHRPVRAHKPDPNTQLAAAARKPEVWTQSVGPALTRQGPYKTGSRIESAKPAGPAKVCHGPNGKTVSLVTGQDGRVSITHDPPPISEITFSGGGGKGSALSGAVRALHASGALKDVKVLSGASVGSMTAAMLAAGMTADAFQKISDDTKFGPLIKGGDLLPVHVAGDALEDLVRASMGSAIQGQIVRFQSEALAGKRQIKEKDQELLKALGEKFASRKGPTFADMRALSKLIPEIKEVVITGTMVGKSEKPKAGEKAGKIKDVKPQLIIFSADTQPKMEIAAAVHASAALPPVFKSVKIELETGEMAEFEDGGVLNNAPTSDNLGTDRAVDPVPQSGKMTFVFQDDNSADLIKGKVKPNRSRMNDWISGAENSAAEYEKSVGLGDRAEDLVVVPLKFPPPKKKERAQGRSRFQKVKDGLGDAIEAGAEGAVDLATHPIDTVLGGPKGDFTGLLRGTMNFDMARDDRVKLQAMTEDATEAHLAKRKKPETRSFANQAQMLACAPRADLVAMAAGKVEGAAAALKFRDGVVKEVKTLEAMAGGGHTAAEPKIQAILKDMDAKAAGDQERLGFIGRELNRTGKLDTLLGGAPKDTKLDSLAAGAAVAALLAVRKKAKEILSRVVYPKMVREGPKGPMGALLAQMDTNLRDASSNAEINRILRLGIDYFGHRFDAGGALGHQDFADALKKQLQPEP